MNRKEFILYYLEQCWYMFFAYCFVVFMDWYIHCGLHLFHPIVIILYLLCALIITLLERRIRNKNNKKIKL
jgi:hypothetical protein